jgi:putative flippase GtrA
MTPVSPPDPPRSVLADRLDDAWRRRTLSLKAMSFALIGVINTAVDYALFLVARSILQHAPAALALFASFSESCRCGRPDTILLIVANMMSWIVAVSGSYILNSSITFAAESGRKLSWRHYLTFVVSGIAGLIANTTTLVFAAQVLALSSIFRCRTLSSFGCATTAAMPARGPDAIARFVSATAQNNLRTKENLSPPLA